MNAGFVTSALLAIAAVFFTQQAGTQEKPAPPKPPAGEQQQPGAADMAAMMQKWMKVASPGEHHKHLDGFVGKWNTATKMWMGGPGTPPQESSGSAEVKWVLDGRFIMEETKGQMMGMPHQGIGLTGYDNYRNMYVATWMDNLNTSLLTMAGSRDPSGSSFTFYGTMDEPMLDVHGRMVKYLTKIVDKDKHVVEIIDLHAGDNYKVVEITYTRAK